MEKSDQKDLDEDSNSRIESRGHMIVYLTDEEGNTVRYHSIRSVTVDGVVVVAEYENHYAVENLDKGGSSTKMVIRKGMVAHYVGALLPGPDLTTPKKKGRRK